MHPLYDCKGPTSWAGPPEVYSYSSLAQIEKCPRQWQLRRSRYGEYEGFPSRPNPAAAEGDVVHRALDLLHRELVLAGRPAIGTDLFRQVVARVDLRTRVAELVQEHEEALAAHPRGFGTGRLRLGIQELANRVVRLFRGAYVGSEKGEFTQDEGRSRVGSNSVALSEVLRHRGMLSELELTHPTISFKGIVDLVYLDDEAVVVADFKSGSPRPEHEKQVLFYALLWWRSTDVCPSQIEVRYLGDLWSRTLEEVDLRRGEELLQSEVDSAAAALTRAPAEAQIGNHCGFCPVRQFCDEYWDARSLGPRSAGETVDLDLTVEAAFEHGLEGRCWDQGATLVAEAHRVDEFVPGDRLRILGAATTEKRGVFELRPWSEVFRMARASG